MFVFLRKILQEKNKFSVYAFYLLVHHKLRHEYCFWYWKRSGKSMDYRSV